jgi:hypothetical protein
MTTRPAGYDIPGYPLSKWQEAHRAVIDGLAQLGRESTGCSLGTHLAAIRDATEAYLDFIRAECAAAEDASDFMGAYGGAAETLRLKCYANSLADFIHDEIEGGLCADIDHAIDCINEARRDAEFARKKGWRR